MSEDVAALTFEHVADFRIGEQLVVADQRYVGSALAGVLRGKIPLSYTLDVEPGVWHAFTAATDPSHIDFLLLCHASELGASPGDGAMPDFDQAESPGLLAVDTDRLLAIDARLRDAPEVHAAVAEVSSALLPVTVAEAGVACGVDTPGIYPVFVSRQPTRTVVFVSFQGD